MNTKLLADTIDNWIFVLRECDYRNDQLGQERMRNWLFGAGMALLLLDDPALFEISERALEASENGNVRNRNVGAGDDVAMGHSRLDSQRENLPTDVETQR